MVIITMFRYLKYFKVNIVATTSVRIIRNIINIIIILRSDVYKIPFEFPEILFKH